MNSSFNGKRKMLRKSLQHIRTSLEIEEALANAGLPATVNDINALNLLNFFPCYYHTDNYILTIKTIIVQSRPEELTLDDFVNLHNLIQTSETMMKTI